MVDGFKGARTFALGALGLLVVPCAWLEADFTALDRMAWVQGGREPSGWDVSFHIGGSGLQYRLSPNETFTEGPGPRLTIPAARIQGLRPVPIEIRYTNFLGFSRHTWVTFDVAKGLSGQVRAYLHEGVGWAELEVPEDGAPTRVRFNTLTGECATVRYSVDSDALDRTLAPGESSIVVPGRPRVIAVRLDLCDGTRTEVQHEYPGGTYR